MCAASFAHKRGIRSYIFRFYIFNLRQFKNIFSDYLIYFFFTRFASDILTSSNIAACYWSEKIPKNHVGIRRANEQCVRSEKKKRHSGDFHRTSIGKLLFRRWKCFGRYNVRAIPNWITSIKLHPSHIVRWKKEFFARVNRDVTPTSALSQ